MSEMPDFSSLYEKLHYHFNEPKLLQRALTHRSVPGKNNERLEFLGDAILSYLTASELFARLPKAQEGRLSRLRSALVKGEMLAVIARELGLSDYLILGSGELKSGGQYRESILADALEAIIGAILLDSDLDTARDCLIKWYGKRLQEFEGLGPIKDHKSELQEWLQARQYPLPSYALESEGPPHLQTFYVTCRVNGLPHETKGESSSRRKAEQIAAQHYLELLYEHHRD